MADLNAIVDNLSSLTVMEAAELATLLEEKWGVSAAAPVAREVEDIVPVMRVKGAIEGESLDIVGKTGGTTEIQKIPHFNGAAISSFGGETVSWATN